MRHLAIWFATSVVFLGGPSQGQSINCRFVSENDSSGRVPATGSVVRTATAAIVEYDGGAATLALVCPVSPQQCRVDSGNTTTIVDFSYTGHMVIVTEFTGTQFTAIGLARLACE